ncbi:MAG: ABC transporter permease [Clostridiales Family XIII bacterium]|jgi:putative ABC transport system permease protein|nr:ABC transporter permease [Clostridiales Family XIII bacterium]
MLARKMLRDMGRRKTQFISIFLMAFLAVFIYTGVGSEWRGPQNSADEFYDATNLADIFLYGAGFTEEQVEAIEDIPGVSASERRLEVTAAGDFGNAPVIDLYFLESGEISKPYLAEGSDFDKGDADGIWLGKRFADARGILPGDGIGLILNGMRMEKTVRGLVYSPEHVFESGQDTLTPDFGNHGYAFLSAKAFPVPDMLVYSTLMFNADDTVDLEEKVSAALDGKYSVFLERENHPSVSMFANEIQQHKMMGDIFPVVFLLIALLTMTTTMTRIVANQRIQIGTLKAMGYKKGVILRHYIAYGFFLALFGAALGFALGPVTLPYLFYPSMSGFYTLPEWAPAYAPAFLWVSAAVVLLCTAICRLACGKLLRETPADSLRLKAPRTFRHGRLERTKLWQKFGFNAQWNIRDASRNRIRSLMAVIGVFGCTALVVCALSMNDSMEDLKVWQYETVNRYESKLTLTEFATQEEIDDIMQAVNGEGVIDGAVEIRANGNKKSGTLTVTDGATLIHTTDIDLQPMELPVDGLAITQKMANLLNVKPGDSIEWHMYGTEDWTDSEVAIVYREPVSQGIAMTREYFESLGMDFHPTAIISAEEVTGNMDGVESIQSTADSAAGWDDLTEAMYVMIYLLIAAAAVLSVVVLYNLGLLAFTEMEREMATLKVIGLKTGKLRGLLLTQNLWFSAAGFILGVPGGLWLSNIIVSFSGDEFDFPISLHTATLLISFAFTFGLSVLVNLLFSRKIRRLNMVESLKAME